MTDRFGLKDKVVIVTGAARGISREIAITFADAGSTIVVADINLEGANKVVEEIINKKRGGLAIKVDVSLKKDVDLMVKKVLKKFSTVDILVNNAGICYMRPFDKISENEWDRVMAINLKGTFLCSQAVLPIMKEKNRGCIINLTSIAAKTGGILVGAHYSASKAGVTALTKSLAKYAAKYGIKVNAVSPGFIDTEMTKDFPYDISTVPLGRLGTPKDVARVVRFLTSEDAKYIDGEIIDVDGGISSD
jgi:NAD(P)-dependent dehydrogenase (short-subunit alcohol dehydrogenase family)